MNLLEMMASVSEAQKVGFDFSGLLQEDGGYFWWWPVVPNWGSQASKGDQSGEWGEIIFLAAFKKQCLTKILFTHSLICLSVYACIRGITVPACGLHEVCVFFSCQSVLNPGSLGIIGGFGITGDPESFKLSLCYFWDMAS